MMDKTTEQKLARSLTAKDTELLEYIPYLLQDLWNLCAPVDDVLYLIQKYLPGRKNLRALDLGAGKGAMGVPLAKQLKAHVHMVDIMPEFISEAQQKARAWDVMDLCCFGVEDINEAVKKARGYDVTLLLGTGDVLGPWEQALIKLRETVKPDGIIIIDEVYTDENAQALRYEDGSYLTYSGWLEAFSQSGLALLEAYRSPESEDGLLEENEFNNSAIARRAAELTEKYPDKKQLFDGYVKSQLDECYDLENNLDGALWVLRPQRTREKTLDLHIM